MLEQPAGLEPLGGNLPRMVEVTLLERDGGKHQLLHLVNGSGHVGVSYAEPVRMRDLEVVISFDGEPSEVVGLVSGRVLPWSSSGVRLTIGVPKLGPFEAIRISRPAD